MKWAWRVGQVAGIKVYIHFTFLFLLVWIGVSSYVERRVLMDAVSGIGFILLLFFVIVLHELGHALTAKRFGIQTQDITLLPIGGVARLDRMPDRPSEELQVALAGPAVNVVIAVLLGIGITLAHAWSPLNALTITGGNLAERFFFVNAVIVVFNMVPAFPMDGGRVLRALLAMKLDYVHATRIAATIGQSFAMLMGFVGLFFNPLLVFIALFVWLGAAQEAQAVEVRSVLAGVTVRDVMITRFQALAPDDTVEVAAAHVLEGFQEDFPVMVGDKVVGVLTRNKLLQALARRDPALRVEEAMEREFIVARPTDRVDEIFQKVRAGCCETVPVTLDGQTVGLLTTQNIGEFLLIGRAKQGLGGSQPG